VKWLKRLLGQATGSIGMNGEAMFNRDKSKQLEKYYADLTQKIIVAMLRKYGSYLVASSSYDTGGILTEPWKRHITFIFKSREVHQQVKQNGVLAEITARVQEAVIAANVSIHDEKPLEIRVASADIDAINDAGGYYYYFK
jgi:hypothetical protein